ncbi:hypothetical protein M3Y98_01133400 [Aphelenchoides besseyi]|nr:hypothetical protein M3Y98_01133400 [Aphelenchoides besseyi]
MHCSICFGSACRTCILRGELMIVQITDLIVHFKIGMFSKTNLPTYSSTSPSAPHRRTPLTSDNVPVWVYVIFRKNPSSGHDKVMVNVSTDGPVFWNRHVVYVFCCSCHFDRHEGELLKLLSERAKRVERVCLVDRPVDYSFLPDSLFSYMANALPNLQFIYCRELDLERINRATVEKLSKHRALKKLIVHGCRRYEVLKDFGNLPQLLVVQGEIIGLKQMVGDIGELESAFSAHSLGSAGQSEKSSSSCNGSRGSRLSSDDNRRRILHSPSPIAVSER